MEKNSSRIIGGSSIYVIDSLWQCVNVDAKSITREFSGSVYFSSSGNTKRVAETIADQKNGEIFEINPTQPYTDKDLNYRDDSSRVVQEHAQKDLRPAYEGDVADWNSYDTIYIGYPLWWQQAPPVVYTFVEHHPFQGKKVIPFCTSSSSPLGTSGKNLAQAAGSGDWQEGVRFSGGASKNEVLKWLKQQ